MAEHNPPLYLDQDDAYSAADLGLPFRDIMGEGVVGLAAGELLVTQDTGSDLKSKVAAGAAWVKGDDDANAQPTYRVYNDAPVLLNHAAADATNPRVDRVVAQVLDAGFSGVSKLWRLAIVPGVATAGATLTNLTGVGALPNDAITLGYVLIPAGAGAVTNANIKDARTSALVGGGAAALNVVVSPGTQLDYQQITASPASVVATSEGTAVALISGNSITYDGSRVKVEFFAPSCTPSVSGAWTLTLVLLMDTTVIGHVVYSSIQGASGGGFPLVAKAFHTPPAGAHTYKVAAYVASSGVVVVAGAGGPGNNVPAFLQVAKA